MKKQLTPEKTAEYVRWVAESNASIEVVTVQLMDALGCKLPTAKKRATEILRAAAALRKRKL